MRFSTTMAGLAVTVWFLNSLVSGQDLANSRSMPGNDAPAGPHIFYWGALSKTPPQGKPENHWRYRLHNGRWWFWTPEENWSYFNGDTWVPYTDGSQRELNRGALLGPISGGRPAPAVIVRGNSAGLTLIPGDHAAAPHQKRGTVLPKYLRQEPMPESIEP